MKIVLNLELACQPDEADTTPVKREVEFIHAPHWCYLDEADLLIIHAHCPLSLSEEEKATLTEAFLPTLKAAPQQDWEPWEIDLGVFQLSQHIRMMLQQRG
jgi:hypothetical protein